MRVRSTKNLFQLVHSGRTFEVIGFRRMWYMLTHSHMYAHSLVSFGPNLSISLYNYDIGKHVCEVLPIRSNVYLCRIAS